MDNNKLLFYQLKKKNILKWYEYVMTYPEEEIPQDVKDRIAEDIPEINSQYAGQSKSEDDLEAEMAAKYSNEEVDLATTGLSEDDQALVADIMARFEQVKSAQAKVDNLFTSTSEEDLVASICSPKQNNVDSLVKKAYDTM